MVTGGSGETEPEADVGTEEAEEDDEEEDGGEEAFALGLVVEGAGCPFVSSTMRSAINSAIVGCALEGCSEEGEEDCEAGEGVG